jgi:hypothetical protein
MDHRWERQRPHGIRGGLRGRQRLGGLWLWLWLPTTYVATNEAVLQPFSGCAAS